METLVINGVSIKFTDHLPAKPKLQLSEDCPCSSEFRNEFNLWLRDRFGTAPMVVMIGSTAYASRHHKDEIIKLLEKNGMLRVDHGF